MNAPRPAVLNRLLRGTLLGLLAAFLALAASTAWLLGSAGGNAWLLARVPGLTLAGVQGSLLGGRFAVERVDYSDASQRWSVQGLTWQDAQWRWRPHAGAWVGLTLVGAHAARVEESATGAGTPVALPASLRLPLSLALPEARIDALHLEGSPPFTNVSASLRLAEDLGATHRLDTLAFTWDRAQVRASGQVASDAPFAIEARASANSLAQAAPPWSARAQARGDLATLALSVQLDSTAAAGAALNAQAKVQAFAAWPLASLALSARNLDLAAFASHLPATRLSGQAEIESTGRDKPIMARITLANALAGRWDQQRLPVAALDLDVQGQAGAQPRLDVQRFAMRLPEGAGRIEGSGQWQAETAELALRLKAIRPALLDARAPALALSGSAKLQLVGLPLPNGQGQAAATQRLQATLALEGSHDSRAAQAVRVAGQARAERSEKNWQLDVEDLQVQSGAASLRAKLALKRRHPDAWQLRSGGEFAGLDPAHWWPAATAPSWRPGAQRLAGNWQAELSAGAAAAQAKTLQARLLAWRGQAQLQLHDSLLAGVPLQGQLKLDGRTPGWAVDAALQAGANRASLSGSLATVASDDRWRLAIDAPALAGLQPLADLHPGAAAALRGAGGLSGQLSAEVQGKGRWPALQAEADLRASNFQGAGLRAARLQVQAQAAADIDAPLALKFDAEQLQIGTLRADMLQARIEGSLAEHRITLNAQGPLRPPAWADALLGGRSSGSRLALRTEGQWQAEAPRSGLLPGRWRGKALQVEARDRAAASATPAWLSARDLRVQLQLDAAGALQSAGADAGRAEVLGAGLRWSQASWQAGHAGQPATLGLDAELEPLAVAPLLTRLLPGAGLGGDLVLAGHARVRGGANVSADVVVERSAGDLSLTDDSGTQAFGLSDLRLALAAQDGTWHFTQALAGANVGVLAGAQSLRLSPQAAWPPADTPMQGVLEWQIADLGAWAPFTPPGWRLSGALRTGASFAGSFGAPELIGEMSGQRLALRNVLQGVDLREGELALSLRGDQASIDRFVVKSGAGELRIAGGANLGASPNASLRIDAERFQVLGRFDRRIVASGNATLALSPRTLALDGRVRIDEGLIDFSHSDAPSLDSDVHVRGGRHNTATAAAVPASAAPAQAPVEGAARAARMALQVDLGEALKMRGRGLDTQLRGNLALGAAAGKLSVIGSVRAEAGSYAAYGQKLDIERGRLIFTGAANNPGLDILALRPNLDVRVGVQVSGSVQLPRIRLFSEPEMSDTEKLSWLVVGRAPDGLGGTDTALLQSAAMALLAGEDNRTDKTLVGGISLDDISVRQTDVGDVKETVVSVGKQISRRWYVGYERGVNSTTGTWQLIYRIAQRFTVRAQAGEDNALDLIWAWRWN